MATEQQVRHYQGLAAQAAGYDSWLQQGNPHLSAGDEDEDAERIIDAAFCDADTVLEMLNKLIDGDTKPPAYPVDGEQPDVLELTARQLLVQLFTKPNPARDSAFYQLQERMTAALLAKHGMDVS